MVRWRQVTRQRSWKLIGIVHLPSHIWQLVTIKPFLEHSRILSRICSLLFYALIFLSFHNKQKKNPWQNRARIAASDVIILKKSSSSDGSSCEFDADTDSQRRFLATYVEMLEELFDLLNFHLWFARGWNGTHRNWDKETMSEIRREMWDTQVQLFRDSCVQWGQCSRT